MTHASPASREALKAQIQRFLGPPATGQEHVVFVHASPRLPRVIAEMDAERLTKNLPPFSYIVVLQPGYAAQEQLPEGYLPANHAQRLLCIPFDSAFAASHDILQTVSGPGIRSVVILADPLRGQDADAHAIIAATAIEKFSTLQQKTTGAPDIHTVVELHSSANRIYLKSLHVDTVVCSGELTENLLAQDCFSPGITEVFDKLLHQTPGAWHFATHAICADGPLGHLLGHTYRQLTEAIIRTHSAPLILCGCTRKFPYDAHAPHLCHLTAKKRGVIHNDKQIDLVVNPGHMSRKAAERGFLLKRGYDKDTVLQDQDRLVFMTGDREAALQCLSQMRLNNIKGT